MRSKFLEIARLDGGQPGSILGACSQQLAYRTPVDALTPMGHDLKLKPAGIEETLERVEAGRDLSLLDSRNRGLSHAGPTPEIALTQIRLSACVLKEAGCGHD
jgi:hypothetical protein